MSQHAGNNYIITFPTPVISTLRIQYSVNGYFVRMLIHTVNFYGASILVFLTFTALAQNNGVLDKIRTGLKYASNYLETAKEVADLVSESLAHKTNDKPNDEDDKMQSKNNNIGTIGLFPAFFRLLGLDSKKISAIAVNSAIFLAQMISSLFDLKPQVESARNLDEDKPPLDPLKFIIDSKNEKVQALVKQAQDAELSNRLIDRMNGLDTSCIRLFLCKTSPIIWAAQRSLQSETESTTRKISSWIPSKREFEENSDSCENRFDDCKLFPES